MIKAFSCGLDSFSSTSSRVKINEAVSVPYLGNHHVEDSLLFFHTKFSTMSNTLLQVQYYSCINDDDFLLAPFRTYL
jgi:hypothetical protein